VDASGAEKSEINPNDELSLPHVFTPFQWGQRGRTLAKNGLEVDATCRQLTIGSGAKPKRAPRTRAENRMVIKMSTGESKAAKERAFDEKLAKRLPPKEVERAEIKKAIERTKARAPRIVMRIEDRGGTKPGFYPEHSDEEGHRYRLADTFGTRSLQFVYSMLNGLGNATADHSLNLDFSPGSPDQVAFNAALAVIDGVRPKDEIEAMLAAHMAVTNMVLLELVARTRGAVAGHRYEGDGIKRLDVLGNLTTKFMRTYTMQVEALARKRRKGEQNIRVKHVHVYAGGQAVVGNVRHRGGRGVTKK
jgi:hypothetical protein